MMACACLMHQFTLSLKERVTYLADNPGQMIESGERRAALNQRDQHAYNQCDAPTYRMGVRCLDKSVRICT